MIVITGALGFIGSCLVRKINDELPDKQLMVVDDFYKDHKERNLDNKFIREWVHRDIFLEIFSKMPSQVDFVFHLGARTDTTSADKSVFDKLNVAYSKSLWNLCTQHQIPLIYASSAATYGDGSIGYSDDHQIVEKLQPLNAYAVSKNEFDKWVLKQKKAPPYWAGLKFFNVFGPNEYHKNRMASVVYHAARQIKKEGVVNLFKSHKKEFKDGEQKRDFIYVKDVVDVCYFLYEKQKESGLYNVGTGQARPFLDLANILFSALKKEPNINYIDTPKDIRKNYQYFTEADISKLRKLGYKKDFQTLEKGIQDYVQGYLLKRKVW